jgi:5-hydroxyisourate hydrolase
MAGITTHVLDTARGRPASGVPVALEIFGDGAWKPVGHGVTDADGRYRELTKSHTMQKARYRITFDTTAYFDAQGTAAYFFPSVTIDFVVADPAQHFHVPLLVSPFGYSTYRGS